MSYTVMELLFFFGGFLCIPRAHGPRAVPVSRHKEGWHLSPLFTVNGSEAGNDPRFPSDKYIIPCHMFQMVSPVPRFHGLGPVISTLPNA